MSSNTFELNRAPCRIESVTFAKSKPRSVNDEGAGVKKLKLWMDVTRESRMTKVMPLFGGLIESDTDKRVAAAGGAGFEIKSRKRLGVSSVKLLDPQGEILVESPTARIGFPRLSMSKEAKTMWLVLDVEMQIPKAALKTIDDYFRADVLASIANAQLDLEDEADAKVTAKREEKAKKKASKKGRKAGQVDWEKKPAA